MTTRDFETEFRRLYLPLCMYALRLTGDVDDAEDLVEDSFMRVWQRMEQGDPIDNLKAFMYMSVRNACISSMRHCREKTGLEFVPEIDDETVDTSERDARIWRAVDELPGKCREIFLLGKRDGLSYEEIAEELGISVHTVRNQMAKAMQRMRDALKGGHKPFFLPFL